MTATVLPPPALPPPPRPDPSPISPSPPIRITDSSRQPIQEPQRPGSVERRPSTATPAAIGGSPAPVPPESAAVFGGLAWPAVVALCVSRSFQAVVQDCSLAGVESDIAVVRVPGSLRKIVEARMLELEQLVSKAAGRPMKIRPEYVVPAKDLADGADARNTGSGSPAAGAGATSQGRGESSSPQTLPASSMTDHPLVRQAAELLGARLIRVERRDLNDG